MNFKKVILTLFSALLFSSTVDAQNAGKITGVVVDAETGETLIGVNVVINTTTKGTATDLDGRYTISNVAPGTYTLRVTYISYATQLIEGVKVGDGETLQLDITLQEETEMLDEVVVSAAAILNNEAGLLRERQKSIAFSDAISAETISKTGVGDATGVMKKVVGASVIDGKYVYVRGLGDRYSSSHLNGVELPSADPDRKSFQFDIFPSNLLENIVTLKSFTPDKPGNFSGGLVNVNTKSFPESETFSVSFSSSYNTLSTGQQGFLSQTSSSDLLAFDNGLRDIPKAVQDLKSEPGFTVPSETAARFDPALAQTLDQFTTAFNSEMAPMMRTLPINTSTSISYGNQARLFGNALGYSASLSYGRSATNYTDGKTGRWQLIGGLDESNGLTNLFDLDDSKGSISVDLGGLFGLSYKLDNNNRLSSNVLITQNATHYGRNLSGIWTDEVPNDIYESSVISYTERSLRSYQLQGKHVFPGLGNSQIDWNVSLANNTQEEPDLRFLTFLRRTDPATGDEFLSLSTALIQRPARFFRDLDEESVNYFADYSLPFRFLSGNTAIFKTGVYYQQVDRNFTESRFEYLSGTRAPLSFTDFMDNVNGYFGYTGIVETESSGRPIFGNTLRDASNIKNTYKADKEIFALYGMFELPVTSWLKVVGGLRQERAEINTISADSTLEIGSLDNIDLLPSISTVFSVTESMNIRASYTNTIARPTFRELAPYTTFDFVGDFIFSGNAGLEQTLIKNADIRWEWFPNVNEIVAVSAFYKDLTNPIERVVRVDINRAQTVRNVPDAQVYGVEFELRKNLGFMADMFRNISFSSNLTFVESRVRIPDAELFNIRINDPDADKYRQLTGQSPYLINLDLEYFNPNSGLSINSSFNHFGDRLNSVALGAIPDVFERGYSTLGLVASKSLRNGLSVKLSGQNLLDPDIRLSHELDDEEFIYQSYRLGRTISLGVSYIF
ncbi:TonB-dependent receptor domain-containing protein [Balneola sp. MJW-20]|uniref:TonB-dependent receptor n=1 Tax=Gracilimonas aurantiaca TaxID=3234185 RepID=UPI0034667790